MSNQIVERQRRQRARNRSHRKRSRPRFVDEDDVDLEDAIDTEEDLSDLVGLFLQATLH